MKELTNELQTWLRGFGVREAFVSLPPTVESAADSASQDGIMTPESGVVISTNSGETITVEDAAAQVGNTTTFAADKPSLAAKTPTTSEPCALNKTSASFVSLKLVGLCMMLAHPIAAALGIFAIFAILTIDKVLRFNNSTNANANIEWQAISKAQSRMAKRRGSKVLLAVFAITIYQLVECGIYSDAVGAENKNLAGELQVAQQQMKQLAARHHGMQTIMEMFDEEFKWFSERMAERLSYNGSLA